MKHLMFTRALPCALVSATLVAGSLVAQADSIYVRRSECRPAAASMYTSLSAYHKQGYYADVYRKLMTAKPKVASYRIKYVRHQSKANSNFFAYALGYARFYKCEHQPTYSGIRTSTATMTAANGSLVTATHVYQNSFAQ